MDDSGLVMVARHAMATRFEIALAGAEPERLRAAGEAALDEIERQEARLSLYRPQSDVSCLNARAAEGPVKVDPRLFHLLERAKQMSDETAGAFDITVAPLVRAWGFAGGGGQLAGEGEIEAARARVGMDHVRLNSDDVTVAYDTPGVEIDLGAIGKGYAVDRAAEVLRECGVVCGLIHGGTSSVFGLGSPQHQPGWAVAIQHPDDPGASLGTAMLRDSTLSVSAAHGKAFVHAGQELGHVLDPRTGRPARRAALAAVTGPSATDGDALSTALLVLGEEGIEMLRTARPELGLGVAVRCKDGSLRFIMSGPGWE